MLEVEKVDTRREGVTRERGREGQVCHIEDSKVVRLLCTGGCQSGVS